MITKQHIEQVLKLNGLDVTASDQEIKTVLIAARWHEKDVEKALVILKQGSDLEVSEDMQLQTAMKLVSTGNQLNPETISSLLGLDIKVSGLHSEEHKKAQKKKERRRLAFYFCLTIFFSLLIVTSAIWSMGIDILR